MALLSEIYDWFMTGKKPTQGQFWETFASFRLKSDAIPQSDVTNLTQTLNAKTEKSQFDAHISDPNAHLSLIIKARVIPVGQMIVYKVYPNENLDEKEPGDFCTGIVEGIFISANYLGGDGNLKDSYE